MECEVYVLNDGMYQCGNCGSLSEYEPSECDVCGSRVVSIVEEGETPDTEVNIEW